MGEGLIVNEIYRTLAGEGTRAGMPCVIVRLTGCNLRCAWCDTTYAYDEGRPMDLEAVTAEVERLGGGLVLVTGGEPLLQPAAPLLLSRLCDDGHQVLLETNGSQDISVADGRVARCVDVKCPGSGEGGSFLEGNFDRLGPQDEVKFVLADRADYDYAMQTIRRRRLGATCPVILTAAAGRLAPAELAGWLLAEPDPPSRVRLGLQWHKLLWPGRQRGV